MKKLMVILLVLAMTLGLMGTVAMAEEAAEEGQEAEVTIFLTRHGKTLFNTVGRVQGWCDSPLTDAGIEVAENLGIGLRVSGITFDSAYSSDLGRQRDTARIVLDELGLNDMPVRENRGLRESCMGSWEGELESVRDEAFCEIAGVENMFELYADQERLYEIYIETDETGLAETLSEATDRFMGALYTIAEQAKENGESNVLVVASGGIINTLLTYMNVPGGEIKNASVTMLYYNNGEFTIGTVGDLSYADLGAENREAE